MLEPGRSQEARITRHDPSAAGYRADDEQGLGAGDDRVGQRRVERIERKILLAREKAKEWAALAGGVVANGSAKHRVASFQRVQNAANRGRVAHFELHFAAIRLRQPSQMGG